MLRFWSSSWRRRCTSGTTGKGQWVGISCCATRLPCIRTLRLGGQRSRDSSRHAPRWITGLHPTAGQPVHLGQHRHFWSALCELIDLPELAADPRYDTVAKRAEHAARAVSKSLASLLSAAAQEWEPLFVDLVPCAAAREMEDMFDHPQVLAEEIVGTFDHPTWGATGVCRGHQARRRSAQGAAVSHRHSASIRARPGQPGLQRRRNRGAAGGRGPGLKGDAHLNARPSPASHNHALNAQRTTS